MSSNDLWTPPATSTALQGLLVLEEPMLRDLFKAQPRESLRMNQPLYWEGEPIEHVFEINDGLLRLCRTLPDGRRAVAGFLYPGAIVGLSFRTQYQHTAEAVTPVSLRRLSRVRFRTRIAEHPALGRQLHELICEDFSAIHDQLLLLGRKNALERVASFLLEVAGRLKRRATEPRTRVTLPMTRQDIADYLGLTIETVSRCIAILKAEGVISLIDAQRIVIRQAERLRLLADGYAAERSRSATDPIAHAGGSGNPNRGRPVTERLC